MRQSRFLGKTTLCGSLCGAALMALAIGSLPAPAAAADVAKIIEDSRALTRKGDVKSAVIMLKKAVKDNPSSPDLRIELGTGELHAGDFLAAEAEFKVARDLGGAPAQINPQLAMAMLYQNKFDELVRSVQPCPEDLACKAGVLVVHARAHLALKQVGMADADSKAALEAAPNDLEAKLTRGLVLMSQGDYVEAEKVVDEVLATRPKSFEALVAKGDLRRGAADFTGAEKAFAAAAELNPRNINARTRLAITQLAEGKNDEAQANIDKVLSLAPKSILATYLKALGLARTNKMRQALDLVRPLEVEISRSPKGAFLLALIHAGNGNFEEALKFAGIYHSQEPDDLIGAKLLANIDFKLGAYDRVVSTLAPLRDRFDQDSGALNLLGSAYLAEGRAKEADDVLNEAVKLRPDDASARGQLAISKVRQSGTREEGIHELESIVNADPNNAKYDLVLISVHMSNGDFDRAIAAATAMSQRQPNNPLPVTLRGAAKLTKGDEAGAAEDFALALKKSPDFTPATLYQAEIAMRDGDFAKARSIVDQALARNPADIRALLARADVEERAGGAAEAVKFLERAVAAHPDELEPRAQLVHTLVNMHDGARAVAAANDLARTMPNNPVALDMAAKVQLQTGHAKDATVLYQQLLDQSPKSPTINLRLGEVLQVSGDTVGAKAAYDRAIALGGAYLPAWKARIALERKLDGYDAALAFAQKAVKDNPGNQALAMLPGDAMAADGRWADAEAFFRKLLNDKVNQGVAVHLFEVLLQSGNYPQARQFMTEWLVKHPDDNMGRFQLAQEEMRREEYKEAAEQYGVLSKKVPRSATILNNLAWIYGQLHDSRALDTGLQAHLAAPGDGQVSDTYGELLHQSGDLKQATVILRQAHNTVPNDPTIAFHLARALNESKDQDGARQVLRPIVDPKVRFPEQDEAKKLYAQLGGS